MPLDPNSIPTPSLVHLTREDYEHIYDPAGQLNSVRPVSTPLEPDFRTTGPEDSFILLDALELDASELKGLSPGSVCVEIGSASTAGQPGPTLTPALL